MKVGKLKEILKDIPDDHLVVLSKDGEGNDFSPLDSYGLEMYEAESTWSGTLVDADETEEDDYEENCVVLWPTN